MVHMKIIGYAYQLTETKKWKFGGTLITAGKPPDSLPDLKTDVPFDSKQEALDALKKYCAENHYELEIK